MGVKTARFSVTTAMELGCYPLSSGKRVVHADVPIFHRRDSAIADLIRRHYIPPLPFVLRIGSEGMRVCRERIALWTGNSYSLYDDIDVYEITDATKV